MKPTAFLRNFLAIAGSSILAISSSYGETILADSYSTTTLDVTSNTTLFSSLNFPSIFNGALTGSFNLTHTGYFGSQLSLVNNTGNTFTGNIIVDSGTLRIAGNPFATSGGGFVAGSTTASDTITINRAGTLLIDDNVTGGYTANRFGSDGARPAVNLAGGTMNLSGYNNATSSVQTFGALTSSSGRSTINVTRNTAGVPTLTFDSLAINTGSNMIFNGTSLGTSSKITFATAPTLTGGIIAGAQWWDGGNTTNNLVTYDANGVRQLVTADYTDVATDINGVAADANVRVTSTTITAAALTADKTVNSLTINQGSWAMTNKLTITSGMFLRKGGANSGVDITSGTLTAGNGTDDIDLQIINCQSSTTFSGTSVIADNAASAVTLVQAAGVGGRSVILKSGSNNTYTGGTYVLEGTLTTDATANRTYLGTGKVTVDGGSSYLTLGAIGATSNASGDDFTAKNGGTITLSAGNHGTVDTFNIDANSVIAGVSATNSGLASLTRGTNITLAAGAIIGHAIRGSALSLTTGTIQNLGTNADLYYGFYLNQNNAAGQITIGSGTAFRGISTDRTARAWQLGTINIASGTTSVDFQGNATYGAAVTLTLGNGATAGQPVITSAVTGTVDINAIGALTIDDSTATFGNTGSGQNIRFVSTAGSTLTVTAATGMGSGTGIASALVNNGGSLAIGNTAALNGAVTVEASGRLTASQASLTGTGALTFNAGSILQITNATGFSGSQATAASVAAGTIVRLSATFGAAGDTLDSYLSTDSPIYQVFGADRGATDPTVAGTTILTLNRTSGGVGGILTNDGASRTFSASANGRITLGANGGVMAMTTGTSMNINEDIHGAGPLIIGTTDIIDGAPKLGTVNLNTNTNAFTGGVIINAGILRAGVANTLGTSLTNQLTVNTGGTLDMSPGAQTIGNLTGTGGIINAAGRTLTIGQGDNGGGNYQGSIQGAAGALTKTGTGTITLSNTNTYTGATNINAGKLIVNGSISNSSLTTVASGATLGGSGTLGKTTVLAGGILSPGNSPGTMTYIDTLGLNGSTIMEIDGNLGAGVTGGHDFINLTGVGAAGVLTYGGTMTLDLGVLFTSGSYSWDLFNMASETSTFTGITLFDKYSGTLLDADLNGIWDLTSGVDTWQFNESTGVLSLNTTAVPEPNVAALLGGLGTLMLLRRRRN